VQYFKHFDTFSNTQSGGSNRPQKDMQKMHIWCR